MKAATGDRKRIAVIGAGISGLAAAWLLRSSYDVTLYEADNRAGGHADTQTVTLDGKLIPVDTGFIVLNNRNYPHLSAFFTELGVETFDTEMSFAVSVDDGAFEYGGGTIAQLFAQRSNLLRPRFWRMIMDILRFYREAPELLHADSRETVGEYLDRNRYGASFVNDHILPMGAAIWSSSISEIRSFPASNFARFFHNHGLLSLSDRPQWRSVTHGSRRYVEAVLAALKGSGNVRLGERVRCLSRDGGLWVTTDRGQQSFDGAVLACHADQSLALLERPTPAEQRILGAVRCADNLAILHSDAALMPRRRAVWSSWNYLTPNETADDKPVSVTYWMNRLQNIEVETPLLVTLNPARMPDPALVHSIRSYRHPQFDGAAIKAQRALPEIQGAAGVWFAGAWTGWGFHEDGIASAVRVAEMMGVLAPWQTSSQFHRAA